MLFLVQVNVYCISIVLFSVCLILCMFFCKKRFSVFIWWSCLTGSRFTVETAIETSGSQTTMDLKGQNLTAMCRMQLLPLLQELDLSDNSLRQLHNFSFLQCLRCLNLAANQLKNCRGLGRLPCLSSLDLSHNCILPLVAFKTKLRLDMVYGY